MVKFHDSSENSTEGAFKLSRFERGVLFTRYGHRLFSGSSGIIKQLYLLRAKKSGDIRHQLGGSPPIINEPAKDGEVQGLARKAVNKTNRHLKDCIICGRVHQIYQ